MKIEDHKVVELVYELEVDGKVVDKVSEDKPLDYIHGMNVLIPKFEKNISGQEAGYEFSFSISPDEGYGQYNPKYQFDVPKESFEIDGKINEDMLQVGKIIPMMNSSGEVCQGIVAEIKENDVTMDFNHPMAGKTLNFKGKILSVRDATEKELLEGIHGEFLPHECGCGCGGHHEHHDCGCGGHHEHHDCGCGSEDCECGDDCHCGEEGHKDCGCGGHHEHHDCGCGPDCSCREEDGECHCGEEGYQCDCGHENDNHTHHDCGCGGHHEHHEHHDCGCGGNHKHEDNDECCGGKHHENGGKCCGKHKH